MTIKALLGTDNRKEQEAKIQKLLDTVNKPVIDLVIRYDALSDGIDLHIIGGNVSFDTIYKMLDLARKAMHAREIEIVIATQQQAIKEEE